MSKYSFFLLPLLVVSTMGWPWHDDMEQSQPSMSSYWRGTAQKKSENTPFCKSAISTAASKSLSTYVQVCRDDSNQVGFCYYSTLFKCCHSNIKDAIMVNSMNEVRFGNVSVSTSILKAEKGVCVTFLDKNANIKICESSQNCFPIRQCLTPKRGCQINTVEGTCKVDGCTCKPGYVAPDCCKCDTENNFFKAQDGSCKEMCLEMIEQCIVDSCTCKPGYEPDDCCCPTGQKRNHNQMCICKTTEESPVNGVCPVPCIDHQDIIFLLDTSFGNDYSSLWRAGFFLEIVVANLLMNTVDLNILVIPLVNTEDQQEIENLVPKLAHPFDRSQCLKVALSIEDTIYIDLSPNTYSDLTLLLLDDLLVDKGRHTTIITLAGSPSNTANGNIENIIANIHQSRLRIASGRVTPVKYFAVNFINKENILKENYKKELIALAGDNEGRYITGLNWMKVFTNLLRTEGILCDEQKNSIISYLNNTDIFNKYLRCLRKKRRDSSHKCVELEEYSSFCTKQSKASIESKLVDVLQELLGRLN